MNYSIKIDPSESKSLHSCRYHDEEILQPQVPVEHEPVEQKDDRQEDREFYGIEKHGRLFRFSISDDLGWITSDDGPIWNIFRYN